MTDHSGQFLTDEDQWLMEELRFVQKIIADDNDSYAKWEGWFMVAENILLVAAGQLLLAGKFQILAIILSGLGLVLTVLFVLIQRGNHIYATARFRRWVELEQLLSRPLAHRNGRFMCILKAQEEEVAKHRWYRRPLTTWSIRKLIPVLFLLVWLALIIGIPVFS